MQYRVYFVTAAGCLLAACSSSPAPESKKEESKAPAAKIEVANAGSLAGKISFTGKQPAKKVITMDSDEDCKKAHTGPVYAGDVVVGDKGQLANVLVYIKSGLEGKQYPAATATVKFDQKGCMFQPRIVGIQVGQTMSVINSDTVSHNVHPMPRDNNEWNQGQSPGAAPLERQFKKPEMMIPVKCNVHAWMKGYINVLPHPYFAVSSEDGTFEIKGIPPGEYTIGAWHEKLPAQEMKITVPPSGAATANFSFKGE